MAVVDGLVGLVGVVGEYSGLVRRIDKRSGQVKVRFQFVEAVREFLGLLSDGFLAGFKRLSFSSGQSIAHLVGVSHLCHNGVHLVDALTGIGIGRGGGGVGIRERFGYR